MNTPKIDSTLATTEAPASGIHVEPEVEALQQEIQLTRAGLSETLSELEQRLSPTELRVKANGELQNVGLHVKEAMREGFAEAKSALKAELSEAGTALKQELVVVSVAVKEELKVTFEGARSTVKQELSEALTTAKSNIKQELREAIDTAKIGVKQELSDALQGAKGTIKHEFHEAMEGARSSLHSATIGRLENMTRKANDTMVETRDTVLDTIRANPIPAALVGVGVAWLFMNRSSSSQVRVRRMQSQYNGPTDGGRDAMALEGGDHGIAQGLRQVGQRASHALEEVQHRAGAVAHRVSETVGQAAHQVSSTLGNTAHQVSDTMSNTAHRVTDAMGNVVHQVGDTAHRVSDTVGHAAQGASQTAGQLASGARDLAGQMVDGTGQQLRRVETMVKNTMDDNPLALGGVALAVGAVVGLSLPRTEREDRFMGEARDRLLGQARDAVQGALEAGQHVVEKAVGPLESAQGAEGGRGTSRRDQDHNSARAT